MRRVLLWTIAVFLLAAVQSFALQSHPTRRFPASGGHPSRRPPKATRSRLIIDAEQPGVTHRSGQGLEGGDHSDPAAANPGFDDSQLGCA